MIPAAAHEEFRRLIDAAEQIVVVTHLHPDGDAIGSQSSLIRFLLDRNKQVRAINNDPTPTILRFIEVPTHGAETFRPEVHELFLREADLIVLVDNSVPDRLGRMESILVSLADKVLCVDHHPTRDAQWAHSIVDVEACATAAMIYELTGSCGWKPDAAAAQAIYVALTTDTGFFRFNSTSARAHEIAADLLRIGVEPADCYRRVYERNSAAFTRLLGHALTGLRLDAEGQVASVKITRQLIDTLQAEDEDTAEITTSLLAIDNVKVAVLFRELPDGRIKVSLRSKGDLDVHRLATEFGGGGHRNASGVVMQGGLNQVVQLIIDRTKTMLAASSSAHMRRTGS